MPCPVKSRTDAVAEPSRVGLDDASEHVDVAAGTHGLDRPSQRLLGALHEQPGLLVDVAGQERRVGVAVHPVDVRRDVDVHEVAVLDDPAVGDAVADHLVDAGAQRLGEAAIAQRGGVRALVDEELVADPVQLVGGDARRHVAAHQLQRLRGDAAGVPHPLDGGGVLHLRSLVRRRGRPVDVLRARDARGNGATGGHHSRGDGTHAASVVSTAAGTSAPAGEQRGASR